MGRADDTSTRAVRPALELRLLRGLRAARYETTAGSADLGSWPALSSSPMAIPRRLDT